MLCPACAMPADGLCESCTRTLRPVPIRDIAGMVAEAPFLHVGAAAVLVRGLKYRRNLGAGSFLASHMVRCLPREASCIVPIPRAGMRVLRYGVDPASVLANGIGRLAGVPVVNALRAPLWWRSRAGAGRSVRTAVGFTKRRSVPDGAVLIDDVLTTGATAASAARALDAVDISVVTATAVGTMEGGADRVRAQEVALPRSDRASHFGPPMRQMTTLPIPGSTAFFVAAARSRREEDG